MKKLSEYKTMKYCIILLSGHPGLFLLKNSFSLSHLLLTLWTVSLHHHSELLAKYGAVTHLMTEALCNVHFNDNSRSQAEHSVWYGSLELCITIDIALAAFLSSHAASNSFVNCSLYQPSNTQEKDDMVWAWLDQHLCPPSNAHKQRNGDNFQCSSAVAVLVPEFNQPCQACFKAPSRPELGAFGAHPLLCLFSAYVAIPP